jgi:hypothetical protein
MVLLLARRKAGFLNRGRMGSLFENRAPAVLPRTDAHRESVECSCRLALHNVELNPDTPESGKTYTNRIG